MFTPPEAKNKCNLLKEQNKTKIYPSYIKKKKKHTKFLRCQTKEQSLLFFRSPSMTKYLFLLQILHIEMQIFEHEKKKKQAALNKSGFWFERLHFVPLQHLPGLDIYYQLLSSTREAVSCLVEAFE